MASVPHVALRSRPDAAGNAGIAVVRHKLDLESPIRPSMFASSHIPQRIQIVIQPFVLRRHRHRLNHPFALQPPHERLQRNIVTLDRFRRQRRRVFRINRTQRETKPFLPHQHHSATWPRLLADFSQVLGCHSRQIHRQHEQMRSLHPPQRRRHTAQRPPRGFRIQRRLNFTAGRFHAGRARADTIIDSGSTSRATAQLPCPTSGSPAITSMFLSADCPSYAVGAAQQHSHQSDWRRVFLFPYARSAPQLRNQRPEAFSRAAISNAHVKPIEAPDGAKYPQKECHFLVDRKATLASTARLR